MATRARYVLHGMPSPSTRTPARVQQLIRDMAHELPPGHSIRPSEERTAVINELYRLLPDQRGAHAAMQILVDLYVIIAHDNLLPQCSDAGRIGSGGADTTAAEPATSGTRVDVSRREESSSEIHDNPARLREEADLTRTATAEVQHDLLRLSASVSCINLYVSPALRAIGSDRLALPEDVHAWAELAHLLLIDDPPPLPFNIVSVLADPANEGHLLVCMSNETREETMTDLEMSTPLLTAPDSRHDQIFAVGVSVATMEVEYCCLGLR